MTDGDIPDITLSEKILLSIQKIALKSPMNAARPKEIADDIGKDLHTINTYLGDLKKKSFVKNVSYGHWILTSKGLEKVESICQLK